MTEFETKCYGISEDEIREEYIQSITGRLVGIEMVVASILSDCQELISFDGAVESGSTIADQRTEAVRKYLNVAKFILFDALEKRREKEEA